MSFLSELKRRNVVRVALFYLVSAWLLVQVAETVLPLFEVPDGVLPGLVILLALGFIPPQCRPIVTTSGEDDFECE